MQKEISSMIGMEVYTNIGKFVGKVSDIVVEMDGKQITGLAVIDVNEEMFDISNRKGIVIPYHAVITSDDIIIVNDKIRNSSLKERTPIPVKN